MSKVQFLIQQRAYSLKDVASSCGRSYATLWRAAVRGDLRVLRGFGRMMVSEAELSRFLSQTKTHNPKPRKCKSSTDGLELPS